ncbi:hypothetical protein JTE90_010352 [Oedothorax gibbosus]|uniref:Uncharacterized protein n=1 Tax=Oedothorax gibbosus TaxID=931172 RepID=A0AAV6TVW5_9ARAC|nr:hypothetical protein JTE90_010352 [Oedothorax gibbosus]
MSRFSEWITVARVDEVLGRDARFIPNRSSESKVRYWIADVHSLPSSLDSRLKVLQKANAFLAGYHVVGLPLPFIIAVVLFAVQNAGRVDFGLVGVARSVGSSGVG